MTEKRVSVRLVAVGGRQVRAELEGVGEAGTRGFARLSREMEAANARLGSFARKAGLAMAALTTAAAAAGVAMVRSGLDTIGAQADMAASLKTTVESLQVLTWAGELAGVSLGEIEQATKKLTNRLSDAAAGSGAAVGALARLNLTAAELQALPLDQRIVAIQEALVRMVPEAERAAVAADLFGDRAALAFLRIDPETLREAAKDVRDFGVAVSAADAVQIERTGDAIAKLSLIWLGLTNRLTAAVAPALEAVANTMADAARGTGVLGAALNGLFDNLGRIGAYAATFAAVIAGRWVAGLALAAMSVRGLATALVVLRGALIRTGIGAIVVGLGELVYQFTRLVAGAGSVGAAMELLGDLAEQVWDRISLSASSAWAQVEAGWAAAQAVIYEGLDSAQQAVVSWANAAVGTFQGGFDAIKVIWGALPQTIGDFAFRAANGLIAGVEAMLNAVVTRINGFVGGLNAALALLPDWAKGGEPISIGTLDPIEIGRMDNPFANAATEAGKSAADAFREAMGQSYVEAPDLFAGMADAARGRAEAYREAAGMLSDAASQPLTAWQALQAAIQGAGTEGEAALGAAVTRGEELEEALTQTGGAARGAGAAAKEAGAASAEAATAAKAAAEEAATGWQTVASALADYARDAMDWGKGLGNSLVGAFRSAESAFQDFVKTGKFDFKGMISSILSDLALLAFRRGVLGPIANALSGVFAGVFHTGGMVGAGGGTMREVSPLAFAHAPRMHSGGWAGLAPDEVPAILQRGERVLSRREVAGGMAANSGDVARVRIELGEGLVGRILDRAASRSVEIVQGGLQDYDRLVAPRTIARVSQDPRRSG